ncbi:hypothetical protein KEM48_001802 [Puccinia striiformis f. sp. tritici PST-130]|nr:hypothetical protein KEM48_001802 [Puccinia striiformis f. sp. tritici PST-130]
MENDATRTRDENDDGEDEEGDNMAGDGPGRKCLPPPPSPPSRISGQLVKQAHPVKNHLSSSSSLRLSRLPLVRLQNAKVIHQRRGTDEEDDELAEDSPGFSDGDDNQAQAGAYQASNGSYGASTGDDTMPTAGQLTVRQRAKEYGEPVTELQSLPMTDSKKTKELTEADRAMEKAEKSRKRKHQNEKKLEDEKKRPSIDF